MLPRYSDLLVVETPQMHLQQWTNWSRCHTNNYTVVTSCLDKVLLGPFDISLRGGRLKTRQCRRWDFGADYRCISVFFKKKERKRKLGSDFVMILSGFFMTEVDF